MRIAGNVARLALVAAASLAVTTPVVAQPNVVRTYSGYTCLTDPFANACALDVWATATSTYDPSADVNTFDIMVRGNSRTGIQYILTTDATITFGGFAGGGGPTFFLFGTSLPIPGSTTVSFPLAASANGPVRNVTPLSLHLFADYDFPPDDPRAPGTGSLNDATLVFSATPEPATLALFGSGLAAFGLAARRRRRS